MKRIVSAILASLMVLSLASCSSKPSGKTSETEASSAGPVELRMAYKDEGPSNSVSVTYFGEVNKQLQAAGINAKLKLIDMPSDTYAEKLKLMIMSGDIPDIMYFQGGDQSIADQKLLVDLTPYIEKSKYIKSCLQPQNITRLKNYPYLLWIKPIDTKVPIVRKDWLKNIPDADELISNPTIDNYYKLFEELASPKTGANPEYAITIADNLLELDTIFNQAFGNTATWIKDSSGKYVYSKVTENEKNKLAFYNKLYKNKLLDNAYITKKWDTKEQAFYQGKSAVIVGTCGSVINLYDSKLKAATKTGSIAVLPPAKGVSQGYTPTDVTKESRGIAISAQSKHIQLAFDVLDWFASPDGQMLDRLGNEGIYYNIKDGKVSFTDKASEWYARFWEPAEWTPKVPLETPLLGDVAADSLKQAQNFYKEDKNFIMSADYTTQWDALTNLYTEEATKIITGKVPVSDFDKFVENWYAQGGKEITEYANTVLK